MDREGGEGRAGKLEQYRRLPNAGPVYRDVSMNYEDSTLQLNSSLIVNGSQQKG